MRRSTAGSPGVKLQLKREEDGMEMSTHTTGAAGGSAGPDEQPVSATWRIAPLLVTAVMIVHCRAQDREGGRGVQDSDGGSGRRPSVHRSVFARCGAEVLRDCPGLRQGSSLSQRETHYPCWLSVTSSHRNEGSSGSALQISRIRNSSSLT